MATLTVLQPGIRYQVAKSGAPSTTIAKAQGVSVLPPTGVLRKVGDTVTVADGLLWADQPIEVSVDLGTVTPVDGSTTVLAGATAALRRIVNVLTTTAAPTLATDGYAVAGYTTAAFVLQTNGNVTFHLWGYDANSGVWSLLTSLEGWGDSAGDMPCNNTQIRPTFNLDYKGLDRLYLQVHANAAGSQASAWLKVVPPRTTFS